MDMRALPTEKGWNIDREGDCPTIHGENGGKTLGMGAP